MSRTLPLPPSLAQRRQGARLPQPALGAHPPRWSADRGARAPAPGARPVLGRPDRAGPDLRRPGRHRHRERAAPERAAGADGRADALGRPAHRARRGRPGGQLDARPRHGADDHRLPRRPARGRRRRLHLRVRRGGRGVRAPRHAQPRRSGSRAAAGDPAPEGRGRHRAHGRSPTSPPRSRTSRSRAPTTAGSATSSSARARGPCSPCPCSARITSSAASS